jgi:ubiquitin-large subunit ribosomal protein L40e
LERELSKVPAALSSGLAAGPSSSGSSTDLPAKIVLPKAPDMKLIEQLSQSINAMTIKDPNYIEVLVKVLSGRTVQFQAKKTDTIETLKAMLQVSQGIDRDQQRLIYGGRELENTSTIEDVGISTSLHLTLKLKGSGKRAKVTIETAEEEDTLVLADECKSTLDNLMIILRTHDTVASKEVLKQVDKSQELIKKEQQGTMLTVFRTLDKKSLKSLSSFPSRNYETRVLAISKVIFPDLYEKLEKASKDVKLAEQSIQALTAHALNVSYNHKGYISWQKMNDDILEALTESTSESKRDSCVVS